MRTLLLATTLVPALTKPEIQKQIPASPKALWEWRKQLAQVRELRTRDEHEASKLITHHSRGQEASFTRLMSHDMWSKYSGQTPLQRWWRTVMTWHHSTVLRAVLPAVMLVALWSFLVVHVDTYYPALFSWLRHSSSQPLTTLPIELQGSIPAPSGRTHSPPIMNECQLPALS